MLSCQVLIRQVVFATAFSLPCALGVQAQTYTVIHNFGGSGDGSQPDSPLTIDPAGNLYGSTIQGGSGQYGTVFQLSPNGNGTWNESILYNFDSSGDRPGGTLALDVPGNLYGASSGDDSQTFGTVYELSSNGNGNWTREIIHSFTNGLDGGNPGPVVVANSNQIYGVCDSGETRHLGFVFAFDRLSVASWYELFLHTFTGGDDGEYPGSPFTPDGAGNLYGVSGGGPYGQGTVFKLTPNRHSFGWSKSLVYAFQYPYGTPQEPFLMDSSGNLYGAGREDGTQGWGTIHKLSPNSDGTWTFTVLYQFKGANNGDGAYPDANLVMDAAGNIYGATSQGGSTNGTDCMYVGCGTIFKLTPSSNGQWTETILYEFNDTSGGWQPNGGLIADRASNLYGVTAYGGTNRGVAFEFIP